MLLRLVKSIGTAVANVNGDSPNDDLVDDLYGSQEMETKTFLQMRAEEVMVRDVTILRRDDTLANAAYTFLHKQISGAPVVDGDGACLGVLSVTDILGAADKVAERQAEVAEAFFSRSDLVLPATVYEEELSAVRDKISPAAEQPVENFMITDVVAVRANDTLEKVARDFVDARIHRVLVLDENQRLVGLITTTDVIAALLRSSGEDFTAEHESASAKVGN